MFFLKSIMIIIWHPWLPWVSSTVHEDTKVPPPIPVTPFLVKNVSAGFQDINLTALVSLTSAILIPDPWVSGTGSDIALHTALPVPGGVLMTFASVGRIITIRYLSILVTARTMAGMSPDLVNSNNGCGHQEVDWQLTTVDRLSNPGDKWHRSWPCMVMTPKMIITNLQ